MIGWSAQQNGPLLSWNFQLARGGGGCQWGHLITGLEGFLEEVTSKVRREVRGFQGRGRHEGRGWEMRWKRKAGAIQEVTCIPKAMWGLGRSYSFHVKMQIRKGQAPRGEGEGRQTGTGVAAVDLDWDAVWNRWRRCHSQKSELGGPVNKPGGGGGGRAGG